MKLEKNAFRNCFSLVVIGFVVLTFSFVSNGNAAESETAKVVVDNSQAANIFNKMSATALGDPRQLDDFNRQFPDSEQGKMAFAMRFAMLQQCPTIDGYKEFIAKYPGKRLTDIALQNLFELYRYQNTISGYYDFIKCYPNTKQSWEAQKQIHKILFDLVYKLDTGYEEFVAKNPEYKQQELKRIIDEYDAFIATCPNSDLVDQAIEQSTKRAIQEEQNVFDEFLKGNPNHDEIMDYASKQMSIWEQSVDDLRDDLKKTPEGLRQVKYQLRIYQIDRRGDVLQKVYAAQNHTGRIQATRNADWIREGIDEIHETIKKNHEALLKKSEENTERICKQLYKDNLRMVQTLQNGFRGLHKDLCKINKSVEEGNKTLDNIDGHFFTINDTLLNGLSGTNVAIANKFEKLAPTLQRAYQCYRSCLQRNGNGYYYYTDDSYTCNLQGFAEDGYESQDTIWECEQAEQFAREMKTNFADAESNTSSPSLIAKIAGMVVSGATFYVAPHVAPFIAPTLAKLTVTVTNKYVIPCTQDVLKKWRDSDEPPKLSAVLTGVAKERCPEAIEILEKELPKIWQEEKSNLLKAAKILCKDANIPEKYSEPILNAVNEKDLSKAIAPLAKEIGVPEEVIRATGESL